MTRKTCKNVGTRTMVMNIKMIRTTTAHTPNIVRKMKYQVQNYQGGSVTIMARKPSNSLVVSFNFKFNLKLR